MKVGILGLAHGHVNAYCTQWRERDMGVNVVAGWDHDAGRAQQAADRHGVTIFDSAKKLLREDIDAVVIAAETSMHAELVEQAAAAGRTIILQKPMSLTMEEADRIVEAVGRYGVPCTMAWQMRVDTQNLKMKELIEDGALGRIFMVRRRHCLSTHVWDKFDESWHVNPKYNRDIWADDASHPMDFIYWLMGMPSSVTCELGSLLNPKVPNDNGIAVFRYEDGRFAEVVCSFVCITGENTTEITGEKGVIIQNYGDGPSSGGPRPEGGIGLKWYLQEAGEWTVGNVPGSSNQGERIAGLAEPLAEFLHGRRGPVASVEEGREVMRMMLACYESNEKGKRIELCKGGK